MKSLKFRPDPFLLFRLFIILLLSITNLFAANECSNSSTAVNLTNTTQQKIINGKTNQKGDTYYVNVDGSGIVNISVTIGNSHLIQSSLSSCPSTTNGVATQSLTIDSNDLDFNIMVYRTTNGAADYELTINFTPTPATITEYHFGDITIPSGATTWKQIDFPQAFTDTPVVFATASASDAQPTTVKIRNVTVNGFEIAAIKPPLRNSTDNIGALSEDMQIGYFAISKGTHTIDGITMKAGTISTNKIQSKYPLGGETIGWESIDRTAISGNILVIADTQTMTNEGLAPPLQRSDPFAEVAIQNITNSSNFDIALERAETSTNNNKLGKRALTQNEIIAYLIIQDGANGNFTQDGENFRFQAIRTPDSVTNSNYTASLSSFTYPPMVVASQNSRDGTDGGWVRFDNLLSDSLDVFIQEDETNDVDAHTNEIVGILAIERKPLPAPVADYHFDECLWDGTAGEVKDSSENNLHGKTLNSTVEIDKTALINHSADFNPTGTKGHIEIPDNDLLDGTNKLTIMGWINPATHTPIDNNALGIFSKRNSSSSQYAYGAFMGYNGDGCSSDKLCIDINGSGKRFSSNGSFPIGTWRHFAIVYESGIAKVYIDGILDKTQTGLSTSIINSTAPLRIGSLYENGTVKSFRGQIDEFKIFDTVLKDTQVQQIYNNESAKKNYDGTVRPKILCPCVFDTSAGIEPLEFEGGEMTLLSTFTANTTWTQVDFNKSFSRPPVVFALLNSDGGDPAQVYIKDVSTTGFKAIIAEPQGKDGPHVAQNINYLAINKGLHRVGQSYFEVGTVDTKKYQQSDSVNQWQSVTTKVSDCSNPAIVVNKQTVNNETGLDVSPGGNNRVTVSNPFLSTISDTNSTGVYVALEMSETTTGSVDKNETIAYMIASPNIQDNFVDDYGKAIDFETIRKETYFQGWDDICKSVDFINNYTKTPLVAASKVGRIESDGGWVRSCVLDKNKIGLKIDEDTATDGERHHVPEAAGIFVFSDAFVKRDIQESFQFDAWDTFRNGTSDRNISTKIVAQDFDITIGTKDGADFNGTVCASILDVNRDQNFSEQNSSVFNFTLNRAIKDTNVSIKWWKNQTKTCSDSGEDNATNSTDHFAIRPKVFSIQPGANAYAGENFVLDIKALNNTDNPTPDYNETKNTSFEINATIAKSGCEDGVLNIASFSFVNGAQSVDANYTENGDVNITIAEKLGSEFAIVDADDTNDSLRLIKKKIETFSVKPYELNVTNADFNASNNNLSWLYIADLSDMNVTASATVRANNKQHVALQNFSNACYASDVDLGFGYSVTNPNPNVTLSYSPDTLGVLDEIANIDKNITLPASSFIAGTASTEYSFNVDRNRTIPLGPIDISLDDVAVLSDTVAKNENNASIGVNKRFYYGRVSTKDVATNQQNINHNAKIEVYSITTLGGFEQNSINWYEMRDDSNSTYNAVVSRSDFSYASVDKGLSITTPNTTNGIIDLNIAQTWSDSDSAYIHLDIPEYLWYNRYSDYNATSDCGDHPCFRYIYNLQGIKKSVNSGDFTGSSIANEGNYTGETQKIGVKTFR